MRSTQDYISSSSDRHQRLKSVLAYIKYKFDSLFAHGLIFLIPFLIAITALIMLIFSVVYYFTQLAEDYPEAIWEAFMRVLDPCAAAEDKGLKHRFISGIAILCGIVIIAILIGSIVTFMDEKLRELRKGHTKIIERNHTVILGSLSKITDIINELVIANESQRSPSIVILTSKKSMEVQDMISDKIDDSKNTKLIYRNGDPMSINGLSKLSLDQARSIIILAPEIKNPDISTIKTILAIRNNPKRKTSSFHIVAELKEKINLEAAMIAGGNEAMFVQADEIIARIIVQSRRQSGLAVIFTTLLSFRYDEIYFRYERALIGKTFYDAIFSYNKCSVIGLMPADGTVKLFPRLDTVINTGDQIIVIAEDDSKIILSFNNSVRTNYGYSELLSASSLSAAAINQKPTILPKPMIKETAKRNETNLILGWNNKGASVAKELDSYVGSGSELHVLTNCKKSTELINEQLANELTQQKVIVHSGSLTNKLDLQKLNLFSYDYVMLLGRERRAPSERNLVEDADAESLICLLYLQDIIEKSRKIKEFNIVAEMSDIRNRQLIRTKCADDFIVGPHLISKYIAQLSEDKNIKKVYDILLKADGPEIHLYAASMFVPLGTPISYHHVVQETLKYQCLAIGYRLMRYSQDETSFYGIVLNPDKQEQITFAHNDRMIVLVEDPMSYAPMVANNDYATFQSSTL